MSDFSELCPLFDTGVFKEITFPNIDMRNITLSGNALYGSLVASTTMDGEFTFGRTVVIGAAFARRRGASQTTEVCLYLRHLSSAFAAGTIFASATITPTVSILDTYAWRPFTVTDKTFTSTDLLGLAPSVGAVSGYGQYDIMVRYKEK